MTRERLIYITEEQVPVGNLTKAFAFPDAKSLCKWMAARGVVATFAIAPYESKLRGSWVWRQVVPKLVVPGLFMMRMEELRGRLVAALALDPDAPISVIQIPPKKR
jgi:hypothetical protein